MTFLSSAGSATCTCSCMFYSFVFAVTFWLSCACVACFSKKVWHEFARQHSSAFLTVLHPAFLLRSSIWYQFAGLCNKLNSLLPAVRAIGLRVHGLWFFQSRPCHSSRARSDQGRTGKTPGTGPASGTTHHPRQKLNRNPAQPSSTDRRITIWNLLRGISQTVLDACPIWF